MAVTDDRDQRRTGVQGFDEPGHQVGCAGPQRRVDQPHPAGDGEPLTLEQLQPFVGEVLAERGIVLGGSGNGEAMVANRVRGVRCALCWNVESARLARAHNDANCMSLGQRTVTLEQALQFVDIFLSTAFEGGRHARRVRCAAARRWTAGK